MTDTDVAVLGGGLAGGGAEQGRGNADLDLAGGGLRPERLAQAAGEGGEIVDLEGGHAALR